MSLWQNSCLACMRPWVWSQYTLPNQKQEQENNSWGTRRPSQNLSDSRAFQEGRVRSRADTVLGNHRRKKQSIFLDSQVTRCPYLKSSAEIKLKVRCSANKKKWSTTKTYQNWGHVTTKGFEALSTERWGAASPGFSVWNTAGGVLEKKESRRNKGRGCFKSYAR